MSGTGVVRMTVPVPGSGLAVRGGGKRLIDGLEEVGYAGRLGEDVVDAESFELFDRIFVEVAGDDEETRVRDHPGVESGNFQTIDLGHPQVQRNQVKIAGQTPSHGRSKIGRSFDTVSVCLKDVPNGRPELRLIVNDEDFLAHEILIPPMETRTLSQGIKDASGYSSEE